jgi:predicted acyl esterase
MFITARIASIRTWAAAGVVLVAVATPSEAGAATSTLNPRIKMSDGVTLAATVTGQAPLSARPAIVEFSPYGPGSMTTSDGPAYNYVLVQIRGTGDSDGRFDALGNRSQQDVVDALRWACRQSWSDGRLGLNGFSASAIMIYNSLHLKLPCVRTAVLRSGTFELYRDLLWPGGVSNFIPGLGVLALIGAPALEQGFARAQRAPLTGFDTAIGLFDAGLSGGLEHQTLDSWWRERGFRGDVNHPPILMLDSFFDVESRGGFQGFQALRRHGAHLLVVGAHDGAPAGTDDGNGAIQSWFDHYLRGARNGIRRQPRVQLFLSNGSREAYLRGDFVRYSARNWPVPGTRWESLWLSPRRSGTGHSLNDGSLSDQRPVTTTFQSYAAIPTEPSMTDQPNTAIVGSFGLNQAAFSFPLLTETTLAEPQALTYTTLPLTHDVLAAGPAALDLRLSSTATRTAIWAVISDVWQDGTSHPVATGRLSSAYPNVIRARSLIDSQGDVVQPYGDYSATHDATPMQARNYQLEFWPIGNRFKRGHRIRLVILGASLASSPSAPALNTVSLGGRSASRLLLPVVPS